MLCYVTLEINFTGKRRAASSSHQPASRHGITTLSGNQDAIPDSHNDPVHNISSKLQLRYRSTHSPLHNITLRRYGYLLPNCLPDTPLSHHPTLSRPLIYDEGSTVPYFHSPLEPPRRVSQDSAAGYKVSRGS